MGCDQQLQKLIQHVLSFVLRGEKPPEVYPRNGTSKLLLTVGLRDCVGPE